MVEMILADKVVEKLAEFLVEVFDLLVELVEVPLFEFLEFGIARRLMNFEEMQMGPH